MKVNLPQVALNPTICGNSDNLSFELIYDTIFFLGQHAFKKVFKM